jgi:hypothetical protein
MTTKPKTRQAPAPKTTARKNGAKAAPSEPKREISKIRRLVTYWRFLEAEQPTMPRSPKPIRNLESGGALPQPCVYLADRTRPMWIEFRVSVCDHRQHFGNCLGLAIMMRRTDHCFVQFPCNISSAASKRMSPR